MLRNKWIFWLLVIAMLLVPFTSAVAAPAAPVAAPDVARVACEPQQWAWADVPRVDPVIRTFVVRAGTWTIDYAGTWDIWFRNGGTDVYHVSEAVYLATGNCIWDYKYMEIVVPIAAIQGATTVQVHFSRANTHYYDQRWALWELPWAPAGYNPPLAAGWAGIEFLPKEPGNTSPTTIGVWKVTPAGKEIWVDDGFTSEHVSRVAWPQGMAAGETIRLKFCVGTQWLCKATKRSVYDEAGNLIGKGAVVDVPWPAGAQSIVLSVR